MKTRLYYMDNDDCHHKTAAEARRANLEIKLTPLFGSRKTDPWPRSVARLVIKFWPEIQTIMRRK